MSGWYLGRLIINEQTREHSLGIVRAMSDDEMAELQAAVAVVEGMRGHTLIGPLYDSANVLAGVVQHVLEQPGVRSGEWETLSRWRAALDGWLTQFAACRRRTEVTVGRLLGDEAKQRAATVFSRLRSDQEYLLCWEWRNAAQHHIDALSITQVDSSRTRSGVESLWVMTDAALSNCQYKPLAALGVKGRIECLELIRRVLKKCDQAMSIIVLQNEDPLEKSCDLMTRLAADVLRSGEGAPLAMQQSPRDDGVKGWSQRTIPIDMLKVGDAWSTLDAARATAGLLTKSES